jgi:hypothetical protein
MPDSEKRIVEFERLNPLGKAVFLGGAVARLLGQSIEFVIERTVDLVVEAEKAFKEGLDPNVEDAKILEEYEDPPRIAASPGDDA